jgi:copper chaperone
MKGHQMSSNPIVVTLTAPDISCDHCVATVTSAVEELDGVSKVSASADTKVVVVTLDPEVTSEEVVRSALDEAGYPTS